jgi:hypothetical protein
MSTSAPYKRDTPLLAFWVGDHDIFAAQDESQALTLANALTEKVAYILAEVTPVAVETLDDPLLDAKGCLTRTLHELLVSRVEPGYMAGYEK